MGLSPERAVKLYKTAALAVEEQKNEEEVVETPEANKSGSRHIFVGVLALAAIYGGWNWYISNTAPKTTEENIISITPAENPAVDETLNQEPQKEEDELPPAEEAPETDTTVDNTAPSITQTPIEEPTEPSEAAPAVVPDNVVLEFTGETWVELKDKNKVYFQGVFHAGDKKEIEYTDNLFLSVGRPRNVKVFIKGVEKDIVAPRRKMNIPLDSLN